MKRIYWSSLFSSLHSYMKTFSKTKPFKIKSLTKIVKPSEVIISSMSKNQKVQFCPSLCEMPLLLQTIVEMLNILKEKNTHLGNFCSVDITIRDPSCCIHNYFLSFVKNSFLICVNFLNIFQLFTWLLSLEIWTEQKISSSFCTDVHLVPLTQFEFKF